MPDHYDHEAIWKRFYAELDLDEFNKAKTDKERFRAFKKAISKNKKAKNFFKAGSENIKKLYNYGIAQRLIDEDPNTQKSFNRFSEERQNQISAFKGILSAGMFEEKALDRAEDKGFGVREFKKRKSALGRPSKTRVQSEDVTVKRFKRGRFYYEAVWKKGRKGFITTIKAEEVEE